MHLAAARSGTPNAAWRLHLAAWGGRWFCLRARLVPQREHGAVHDDNQYKEKCSVLIHERIVSLHLSVTDQDSRPTVIDHRYGISAKNIEKTRIAPYEDSQVCAGWEPTNRSHGEQSALGVESR